MNARHARDVLVALAACDPAGAYEGTQDAIAAVAEAPPGAKWELALRGGGAPAVKVRRRDGAPAEKAGRRFSAAAFDEPVRTALKTFDALCPISEIRMEKGGGWSLLLARPLAWPLFLRCDLAAPFAARADQLSLLLRDALMIALEFDGEALWARFSD